MAMKLAKNARILVIDDDQDMTAMLVSFLNQQGYQATAAHTARDGLERYRLEDYQIVILDLKLPDMDGLDVLEAIKTIDKWAVVLIITGFGTIETSVSAVKKGAYDFITKPVKLGTLELIISRALEKHTIFKQLGFFRGLTLALIISVPVWLTLGIILAKILLN